MSLNLACLSRKLRQTLYVLGLLAWPVAAFADGTSTPLDMDTAASLALDNQPQLAAQAAGIQALRENAVAARQLPDPKLRFGIASLPVDTFDFTQEAMTQAVVGVTQALPGGRKLSLAGERIEREAAGNEQVLQASRRRVARDTRLAWLDLYLPDRALTFMDGIIDLYARQVEWSLIAYKAGQMSQDDTIALKAMLETSRDRRAEYERLQQRARAALARWVGDAAAGRPLQALPDKLTVPPLDHLLDGLDQHPELRALADSVSVSRSEAEEAQEAYKPDWSVDMAYGHRGGNRADLVSLAVGVDLPLFTANRQDRRLAARLAQVDQAEQRLIDRRRALTADLREAYADWKAADLRLQRYDEEILPLDARRVESALAAYGTAKSSYGRVLEAQRAELEARLARLNLQVAETRAAVALRYFSE
jgi:cobalt-zinc-cadmium efflux system outer membrane protein